MNTTRTERPFWIAALVLLAGMQARAVEQISVQRGTPERQGRAWVERSEITAAVREGGRLLLRADSGSVTVKTAPGDRLICHVVLRAYTSNDAEARRFFVGYELSARTMENGGVFINGRSPNERRHSMSLGAEFEITVPPRFNLDLETEGGDLVLEGALEGEVHATTAGGDIHTDDVKGLVRVETAGGDIHLGNIGQRAEARTAGGDVRLGNVSGDAVIETSGGTIVLGQVNGALRAETAGGDITVAGTAGEVVAQTAGGHIHLGPTGGAVRAETAGGGIWLQGARGRVEVDTSGGGINLYQIQGAIKATTANGPILVQIDGTQKTFGPSVLETSMGDVQVYLPPDLPLTIVADIEMAAGHEILTDFPLTIEGNKEEYCEREIHGRGQLNGGGEVLRIHTVNGNIEIRKLDPKTLEELRSKQNAQWGHWESRSQEREKARGEREKVRRDRRQEIEKERQHEHEPEEE